MDQARCSGQCLGADASARPSPPKRGIWGGAGPDWSCPRIWPGSTIAILASGPSLTQADCDIVRSRGWRAIAVNRSWELAPWADALYACDAAFWRATGNAQGFAGLKVGLQMVEFRDVRTMKWRADVGIDRDRQYLSTGGNSGHQAINLAYHLGAARIVLLGLDCGPGPAGEVHWHGNHPPGMQNPRPATMERWRAAFPTLARDLAAEGVEVINASRRTTLDCFPRIALEDLT